MSVSVHRTVAAASAWAGGRTAVPAVPGAGNRLAQLEKQLV